MTDILDTRQHWDRVFSTKASHEVSWFQPHPATSIEFLEQFNIPPDARIIDVGGGDSLFVDVLLDRGFTNIHVLDIRQYSETSMVQRFQPAFQRIGCKEEVHVTPFNTRQHFLFCSFTRR